MKRQLRAGRVRAATELLMYSQLWNIGVTGSMGNMQAAGKIIATINGYRPHTTSVAWTRHTEQGFPVRLRLIISSSSSGHAPTTFEVNAGRMTNMPLDARRGLGKHHGPPRPDLPF